MRVCAAIDPAVRQTARVFRYENVPVDVYERRDAEKGVRLARSLFINNRDCETSNNRDRNDATERAKTKLGTLSESHCCI